MKWLSLTSKSIYPVDRSTTITESLYLLARPSGFTAAEEVAGYLFSVIPVRNLPVLVRVLFPKRFAGFGIYSHHEYLQYLVYREYLYYVRSFMSGSHSHQPAEMEMVTRH